MSTNENLFKRFSPSMAIKHKFHENNTIHIAQHVHNIKTLI